MTIEYVVGKDEDLTPISEFGPYDDWPRAVILRGFAKDCILDTLQKDNVDFFIQELDIPESVLKKYNRAWVDTWRRKGWGKGRYYLEKRYKTVNQTGETLQTLQEDDILYRRVGDEYVPIDQSEISNDMIIYRCIGGEYRKLLGNREAPDGKYMPFNGVMIPDEGQPFEWTQGDYDDAFKNSIEKAFYLNGVTDVAVINSGRLYSERDLLKNYLEFAQDPDESKERSYENPKCLPGFIVVYASKDEVFAEDGSLHISDAVMLHLISGSTVLVGEPGNVLQMIVPLKKDDVSKLMEENEI